MSEFRRYVKLVGGVPTVEALERVLKPWPRKWTILPHKGKSPPKGVYVTIATARQDEHDQVLAELNRLLGDADYAKLDDGEAGHQGDRGRTV